MQDKDQIEIDASRRRFLTTAATVVGGAGMVAAAVPFVSTMTPSAKTKAVGAPVEVDISGLKPGERKTVKWQGKPVWIVRRDKSMVNKLKELDDEVSDPTSQEEHQPRYANNEGRSVKPEFLVVIGICTHLGCSPNYVKKDDPHNFGGDWQGGFFCPCHGSRFDIAGRVYKGMPAPHNLIVPPHKYLGNDRILIGDDSGAA